ncbi:hypothetical protein MSAN_01336800 [Mycena sanguinolenta]|uniref:Uncharacterized protein n=1 Tax=Mycena sanguinolenta TaxID=230812 RepID=A0A8H6YAH3_9AGAR|nr:hypothetical protein MSAN_01336800 [Mycena sanguinolenta]
MNAILLVLLTVFLFLMIPFTICIIFLLVQPRISSSARPASSLGHGDPRMHSRYWQPTRATHEGGAMNNLMNNFPGPLHIYAYLQFPPATLQHIGRSMSGSRVPGDPEAGIRVEQLRIGYINMPQTRMYPGGDTYL